MNGTTRSLPAWTQAYALIRDRIAAFPTPGEIRSVNHSGDDVEILRYWPDASWAAPADAQRLVFLGSPNEQTARALQDAGWHEAAQMSLLAGMPDDVEQVVSLADTSVVFEAPMNDYDVVEVTEFDRPVARGRMHYADTFGLLSDPDLYAPSDPDAARRAVLANFAGAAYGHGLPWLFLVTSNATELAEGWSKATDISFWQQS